LELKANVQDTTAQVVAADTVKTKKNDLDTPVFSKGRDSTIYDVTGPDPIVYYYGDVSVNYGVLELKADYMEYNTRSQTVYARGSRDSTDKIIGAPVMKDGGQNYTMEDMHYNFKTGKAIISNVITQEGDGYLHGAIIKKMPDNSINIKGGKYTTCDHEHPHFYLHMTEARSIQQPKQTVFGPSYLVLEDVPLYFPLLPFGFVPDRPDRAGGILFPTFTDEVNRGFAMTDLGYYFVFGDYADLALTGDYFTRGSWAVKATSRYLKLYKYTGKFDLNYRVDIIGEESDPDYSSAKNFGIQWNHSMDSKAMPGTNFSISLNFSSLSQNKYGSKTVQDALQNTASSSISYRKAWEGSPFNFSVNLSHSQSMRDSSYALTLPNITLTMNRIYPFKAKNRVGKEKWIEKFAFTYGTTFDNKINFRTPELGSHDFRDFMKNGMKHDFGITLPSMTLLKHIQLSPSVTYGMNWYFQSMGKTFSDSLNKEVNTMSPALSEFHLTNSYSFGLSLSTRLYGIFQFGRNSWIRAIRHMITPSLSASYHPDLGTHGNGWRVLHYVDTLGYARERIYNIFEGQPYSHPGRGKSGSLGLRIGNNLEMKIQDKNDTTGTGDKKIKLIDNLSISTSYNFFADSIKLSNINISANTTIFEKMSISGGMTLDPYAVNERGDRYNKLVSPRLVSANISTGYQFSGGETKKGEENNSHHPVAIHRHDPETGEYLMTEWKYYADFNAPWSFGFNYGYNYNRSYNRTTGQVQHNHNQTLGFSGQIQLTSDLNLRVTSGVDMKEFKLTTTNFDLRYDLHCFEFVFSWIPDGQWQSWSFRINAKSSALADLLKYDKRTSFWDRW
jgi:lipopolysaccharide assembly outer membrane protein LptD (OstA)